MRTLGTVLLLLLGACGGAPQSAPPPAAEGARPAPVTATPTAAPIAPDLDEAAVKAKSHALLDAYDRLDEQAFSKDLGATFGLFEFSQVSDRELLLKRMRAQLARHAATPSRAWTTEHVYVGGNAVVFIGESIERFPAVGDSPASEHTFWHTLVWVREGEQWKAAHWQCQKGGLDAARDEWNMTYRELTNFNRKPNQLLVSAVKGRKPGAALDVAMGQGRNAIYLASQGWKVTGVDISDEGIRIARENASKQKQKLETINADMETWDFGKDRWDLVTLIYAGDDVKQIEKIKASLRKGGLFVVESFHREAEKDPAAGGFATHQLSALFKDGYKIVRDEVVEDIADWGLHKTKLVRFVAQKL